METILFIDHVGFNVVAEKINQDSKTLTVKNPAVLQAAPNAQNQLQVQLLPVLFKEFLTETNRSEGVTFTYYLDRIVLSNAVLEERLKTQYQQMFTSPSPAVSKEPDVVKLFDE